MEAAVTERKKEVPAVFRYFGTWFLWFAVTLTALVLLSVLSASIPRELIRKNILESATYLAEEEELFYQLREGDRRTEIHNYADAITMNILYSVDGSNRLEEILISSFYSDNVNQGKTVIELLVERIEEEKTADTLYDRYWHGMILLLRPLFLVFTIREIRWLFLGALLVLTVLLTVLLVRRKQRIEAAVFIATAMLVQLPMTAFCIEYIPTVLIMLSVSVAMVCCAAERKKIYALCVVSGVCVAFFDFLTTETLAYVVPLAIVYGIWEKNGWMQTVWKELKFLLGTAVSWGLAYIACYVAKWSLAGLVLKENRISTAIEAFLGRQETAVVSFALDSLMHGEELSAGAVKMAGGTVLPKPISAIMINFRLLLGLSGKMTLEELALGVLVVLVVLTGAVYLYKKKKAGVLPVVLLLLGLLPLIRMMVLSSHSIEHCFFVYRALFGTIFCFMTGFISIIDWNKLQRRRKRWTRN